MQLTGILLTLACVTLSSATACDSGYTNKIIKFDDLKAGSKVPNKYPGGLFNWTGFSVYDPSVPQLPDFGRNIKPASGKLVAAFDDLLGVRLTWATPTDPFPGTAYPHIYLNSFYYGCLARDELTGPTECELAVASQVVKGQYTPYYAGGQANIQYNPDFGNGTGPVKMAKHVFTGQRVEGDIEFLGWNLPTNTLVLLDNIDLCYSN